MCNSLRLILTAKITMFSGLVCGLLADEPDSQVLSLEESVGSLLVHSPSVDMRPVYKSLNPDAVHAVRRIVADNGLQPLHKRALVYVGLLGGAEDVKLLRGLVENGLRKDPSQHSKTLGTFIAIGLLARRKVPGAQELLDDLQKPEFWKAGFLFAKDTAGRAFPQGEENTWYLVFVALAVSEDKQLDAKVAKFQSGLKDDARKTQYQWRLQMNGLRSVRNEYDILKESELPADYLTTIRDVVSKLEPKTRSRVGLQANQQEPNAVVKGIANPPKLDDRLQEELLGEAEVEMARVARALVTEELDAIRGQLLINGQVPRP